VTFSGTITGTMPSGTTSILYELLVGYDTGSGGGQFEPAAYMTMMSGGTAETTLPATYQTGLSFSGDVGAGVSLRVWFSNGTSVGGTAYEVPCGCLEGTCSAPPYLACGYGAPSITTTSVTCNLDTGTATTVDVGQQSCE
jgi:hypothetical protein